MKIKNLIAPNRKEKREKIRNVWNNKLHPFKQDKREVKNVSDGNNKYLLSDNYGQSIALSIL